jgi:hypothetical protein
VQSRLSLRRWLTFSVAVTVLVTGLILLSSEAAGTSLAPTPDSDESSAPSVSKANPDGTDSPVVDRLHTWAETGKTNISQAKGGGKNK